MEYLKELDLLPSIYECHPQCSCHGLLCGNSSHILDVNSYVVSIFVSYNSRCRGQETRDMGYLPMSRFLQVVLLLSTWEK